MRSSPVFFPIGSSRLHWAIEYISRHDGAKVTFPNFGYFQSAGQLRTVVEILSGAREVPNICHYIFRRDASPCNPFDIRALTADPEFWELKRAQFAAADVFFFEVSSPVEFVLHDLNVQGNPNYRREIPFAEVWKTGYYKIYEPDIEVTRHVAEKDGLAGALSRCAELTGGKPVILQSHIYRAGNDHGRADFAVMVAEQAERLGWGFVDAAALCETHGFRKLKSGNIDIHHLSWPGARANAVSLLQKGLDRLGETLPPATRDAILEDGDDPM